MTFSADHSTPKAAASQSAGAREALAKALQPHLAETERLTDECARYVASAVAARANIDEKGCAGPLRELVDTIIAENRDIVSYRPHPQAAEVKPASTGNLTKDALARGKTAKPALTAMQAATLNAIKQNPWQTGNLTQQSLLLNLDPSRAERLKREATR